MADLFNEDFIDFLEACCSSDVEYLLVGGYAVILHEYIRSTAHINIWVNKTASNYLKLASAFKIFGASIIPENDFLSSRYDVWAIGVEPNKIEILSKVKGVEFNECIAACKKLPVKNFQLPYIHLKHLLQAKRAAGRFKDKEGIEA